MAETKTKKYDVRKLNTKDLFAMTKIVSKISGELREAIRDLQMRKIDEQLFGIMIFEACLKHAETDMKGILADIAGMTVEEFEKESFDAPLLILEEVLKQDDLKDFFSRVQDLTKNLSTK